MNPLNVMVFLLKYSERKWSFFITVDEPSKRRYQFGEETPKVVCEPESGLGEVFLVWS